MDLALMRSDGSVRATWLAVRQGSDERRLISKPDPFKYFRKSREIIRLAVMMYVRCRSAMTSCK